MSSMAGVAGRGGTVRTPLNETLAWAYLAMGGAMGLALIALRHSDYAAIPMAVVGVGAAVCAIVGRQRNRPQVTRPWTLFAIACIAFVVGAVLRVALLGTALSGLADVASFAGYACMFGGYVFLLRSRKGSVRSVHELIDGAILLTGVGTLALVLFTLPTAAAGGLAPSALLQGAYPVIDVLVIFVALLLSWTSANRVPSYRLLGATTAFLLAGDIGYAILGTQGKLIGSPLMDLPFVVAFTLFGAAALHPSMTELSAIQQRPVQAWSLPRLALLAPALLLPSAVIVWSDGGAASWIGAAAGSVVTLLLLVRALAAVQDHTHAQQGLRHQAMHDPLTGLLNRSSLVEKVDALIRRAEANGDQVDVLFLDIDNFKLVNDTWGHQVGDQVLGSAAERLLAIALPSDVVARIGGDEFVVARYVGKSGVGRGEELAAQIVDSFRDPLEGSEAALVTTVSVGLVSSSHGLSTAEGMLRDADTAMYRAKASGRARCMVFDSSMHDSVRHRVEMELALRYALDRNQLLLHYQPIVSLQTGRVVGAEALLRWAHPGLGMVSPLDFIPIAEETGLIVEIGEWVVSESLRQLARWRTLRAAAGEPDLWIAVNVSARQLRDSALVEHVKSELRRHAVPADLLVLEITESAMMADEASSVALLQVLRAMGVTLAVDDFGTGYSSLGHLRRFPVSKVKIDREFVRGIEEDNNDAAIVRAVVAMSLAMHLEVVAEGIETDCQRQLLQQLGVLYGQGWLFGRPAPAEDCSFVTDQATRLKS